LKKDFNNINRKNDLVFKRVFGHEDSKDILADFLSDVLGVLITEQELTYIKTEVSPDFETDRVITMDIQVSSSKTHDKMNIEMQLHNKGDIERRILYYWGKSFTQELKDSQDYKNLPRQINILITDFDVFKWKNPKKVYGTFQVLEKEEGTVFSDALEIHVLELSKIKKRKDELLEDDPILDWMIYFNNARGVTMEQIATRKPMIKKAITIEQIFIKGEEERRQYEAHEKALRDYRSSILYATETGLQKGIKKGIKKGREEGRKEGREENKLQIARNLLSKNMSLEFVAEVTGLSVTDIKKIGSI
jgi:predicted transposase/invertase (TIGR01784 family)